MTAPLLLAVFDSVYLVALAAWVGGVFLFRLGLSPILERTLGVEPAGRIIKELSPQIHAWGGITAAVALPALVCGPLSYPELRGPSIGIQAVLIVTGAGIMLIQTRPHSGRSGRLDALAMLIGLALLVGFATRRSVQTAGLMEMTPRERIEYDREFSRAFDEIVTGQHSRPGPEPTPSRFRFDEAARQELQRLIEARRARAGPSRP